MLIKRVSDVPLINPPKMNKSSAIFNEDVEKASSQSRFRLICSQQPLALSILGLLQWVVLTSLPTLYKVQQSLTCGLELSKTFLSVALRNPDFESIYYFACWFDYFFKNFKDFSAPKRKMDRCLGSHSYKDRCDWNGNWTREVKPPKFRSICRRKVLGAI